MFNSDKETRKKVLETILSKDPNKTIETLNAIIGDDKPLTTEELLLELNKAYNILFKLEGKLLRDRLQKRLSKNECDGNCKDCPECEQTYVKAAYDEKNKTVYFECDKKDIDEEDLNYILEYLEAPKDTKFVFLGR